MIEQLLIDLDELELVPFNERDERWVADYTELTLQIFQLELDDENAVQDRSF